MRCWSLPAPHYFYQSFCDDRVALIGGVQTVIGHSHGIRRVGIIICGGVERDIDIIGIAIVFIIACLWVFETLELNQVGDGKGFLMVKIDQFRLFIMSDGAYGFGHLFERLAVLFLIGSVGVVFGVIDINKIAPWHGRY